MYSNKGIILYVHILVISLGFQEFCFLQIIFMQKHVWDQYMCNCDKE